MKAFLTILVSASLLASLASARESRPNVILVNTDDQGYGDLGCHGNQWIKTPNLDRLYKQSVRLTDFHASPTCSPTRAALMFGQFPLRLGVWSTIGGRSNVRAGEVMMPELLAASGYRTALFGKWHLGDNYPFRPEDRGFEHVLWHKGGGLCQVADFWGNDYFDDTYFLNGKPVKYTGYCTDVWFREAMKYIEKHRDKPFFCYIAPNAPHGPHHVSKRYSDLYKDNPDVVSPEFYGMITNLDENMGRLVTRLRELKLEANTILIFMTDNGTAASLHTDEDNFVVKGYNCGMRGSKARYYEGGHRVPFFIRWPKGGMTGGRDINELIAHIDLMPTLIDLCGLQRPMGSSFDGISFAPLLQQKVTKLPERSLFLQVGPPSTPRKWNCAILNGKWRLVCSRHPGLNQRDGDELYDIHADPGQKHDVAAQYPEVVERLRADYEAYWKDVSKRFNESNHMIVGSDQAKLATLTSQEWHGEQVWHPKQVLAGSEKSGFWLFDVAREGTYEIALRRWPAEFDNPISAGCPAPVMEVGNRYSSGWPAGRALPIRYAQLKIGECDQTQSVDEHASSVTFEVKLKKGITRMEANFQDKDGEQLCGAYYAYVKRKDNL